MSPSSSHRPAIFDTIDTAIKDHDVVLFMKGTDKLPMCGFSALVVQVLQHLKVPFVAHNVLDNPDLREGIKSYSNWPTIPQLYIKGEFIGGCDIVKEMFQSGELQTLIADKGLSQKV